MERIPQVSVVMPSYNHAPFVRQAMESVLGQRGVELEFLIEDDGSNDGSREVIAQVRDPRIHSVLREKNLGAAATHNALLRRARGEFIALINSDDVWVGEEKLALQLQVLQERPEVGAVFGRAAYIDAAGKPLGKSAVHAGGIFDQQNRPRAQWLRSFFEAGNCLCHPTVLIRRSCYKALGEYDDRLRQIPDFEMWIRLAKQWELHVIDRELVNFRIVGVDNTSATTAGNLIRLSNEDYFVLENFFEGIDSNLLFAGFGDLMLNQNACTPKELEIEKALLFFTSNKATHWMVGMRKIFDLLGDRSSRPVLADCGIDLNWLHQRMGMFSAFYHPLTSNQFSEPPAAPPIRAAPSALSRIPLLRYLSLLRR